MILIHASVRQDQDIRAIPVRLVDFHKKMVQGPLHRRAFIKQHGDLRNLKAILLHVLDFQKIQIAQDRIVDHKNMAVFLFLFHEVSVLSHIHGT